MKLKYYLTRIHDFSAAHRLDSPALDAESNREIYDKCNNDNGHGHDYKLEVTISGQPDEKSGLIWPRAEFDRAINAVLQELDYRHLNREIEYFKKHISTGEEIIYYLWQGLAQALPEGMLYHLKLWETNNNYFEFGRDL